MTVTCAFGLNRKSNGEVIAQAEAIKNPFADRPANKYLSRT